MKSRKKRGSKFGLTVCVIQAIITLIFIAALLILDLIPFKFTIIIITTLVLFWVIPLLNQLICKKRVWAGRILSICMSVILLSGSVYVAKAHGLVNSITGGDKKVDEIVVAVLKDDPAEKLKDTIDYGFGVQYALKAHETEEAVEMISEELKKEINDVTYSTITEQVEALYSREVEAIIFNSAFVSVIEESHPNFQEETKIVYTHKIISNIDSELEVTVDVSEPFTVYLSGIDVAGSIETTGRSDVNILVIVNPTSHQLLLVTTPRDYYIPIPDISHGEPDKLTHAGVYGIEASMRTLSELYDVDVDYYAKVNFTSLPKIIDALGGVDVYSEYEFTTHPYSSLEFETMDIKKGYNHFNGTEALVFARERKNVPGGDFQRGKDQQAIITAMLKKAVSPAILSGAFDIIESVKDNVDTDMPAKFIKSLIKTQLSSMSAWQITSMAAEGEPAAAECFSAPGLELSVCKPDYASIDAIKEAIDKVEAGIPLDDVEIIQNKTDTE